MQDSTYNGFMGIVEALNLMENETVAVIGPQFSVTAHLVSHIANELHVPLLSFAATDPTLTSLQFPFFVRTTQSDLFQMTAIADIIEYYEWRNVIAIYVDDDYGRNGISVLGDKLAETRSKISYKAPLSPSANRFEISNVLFKVDLMDSRVLVLHTYADWGLQVLDAAENLGMLGSGYVWIVTDWLSTLLDTYPPLSPEPIAKLQGVVTLRMHTPDSKLKTNLVSRWSNLTRRNESFGLSTYGLYAYDTVWLLARAIDQFFNQGGNISFSNDSSLTQLGLGGGKLQIDAMRIFNGGNLLLQSILGVNMTGVTGPFQFASDHYLIHPAYQVINVVGNGYRRIGYWSNYSGLSIVPPEILYTKPPNANGSTSSSTQQLHDVIWPGQTTQKPRGWVFPNNGRELRIGVPNRVVYREFVTLAQPPDTFSGYCIDVFTAALNFLPYPVPYKLIPFGDGHDNPKVSDLVSLVAAGVYDAAVGDLAITTNRTRMVDFTQPYIESGLVVVAAVKKKHSNAWAFLRPFTPMMWCVTGIFFLIIGVVVWILEHRINDDFRGPPRRQIVTVLWFSFSTLFYSHRERTLSTLGRVVLIIWLFIVLILNSSYTASLTSILTVEQLSSPVKGIESLISTGDPIGYQRGSFAENYLSEELSIPRSRLVPLNSADDYAKALKDGPKKGGVAAVVDERAYMELFLSTQCEFSIVGSEFSKMGWGFAFPRDSQLAVDMSTAILKLSENGDLQRIHDKWLKGSACRSQGTKEDVDRLELNSFWGLFVLCGFACLLALLAYLIQIVYQFTRHYPDSEDVASSTIQSSRSARIQTFLSFVGEKEEVAKSRSKRKRAERSSKRNSSDDGSLRSLDRSVSNEA
ncbi:hypothetical protein PTKIN_Ptkin07bG0313300 [Pterospermum kingtungense]